MSNALYDFNGFIFDSGPVFHPGLILEEQAKAIKQWEEQTMGSKAWHLGEAGRRAQLHQEEQLELAIDENWMLPRCMRARIRVNTRWASRPYECTNGVNYIYYVETVEEFIERDSGMPMHEYAKLELGCERKDCDEECCGNSGCTPCHHPDTIDTDPFTTNDEGQPNMELSMTVNREKLVEALSAKRDEVAGRLQTEIDETKAKLADVESNNKPAEYLRTIADMVAAGDAHIGVEGHKGRGNDCFIRIAALNDTELPVTPARRDDYDSPRYIKQQLNSLELSLAQTVAPYDAALQLLEMSVDENVGIPASEYQRLLQG